MKKGLLLIATIFLTAATAWAAWRFHQDIAQASAHAHEGSTIAQTQCGPIEYQEAGNGWPLLMVHGSGGGHDQGMAWARPLTQHGVRVIAMSRFGYLRTPRPAGASPEAQAMRWVSPQRPSWASLPEPLPRCRPRFGILNGSAPWC